MAEELRIERRPSLERPVLVACFRGWNDGGQAASLAGGYLAKSWGARRFADLDPEGFFDFQATRPHVSLVDGETRRIDWPENSFYHGRPEGLDRDVATLLGVEVEATELAEAAETYKSQVSDAVAADADTAAYVEELEQRADTLGDDAELPSGDALAAELTRFLRERERGEGPPPAASEQ